MADIEKLLFSKGEYSDEVEDQIVALQQLAAKANKDHATLYAREERILLKNVRQSYFDQAAARQLKGQVMFDIYLR